MLTFALALALAALLAATPQDGVVFTADGGRLRGSVLEAGSAGVSIRLLDGSTRRLEPSQVARVDFADGTSWKPSAPAPAASAAKPAAVSAPPAAAAAPVAATAAAPPPAAPVAAGTAAPPPAGPAAAGTAAPPPAAPVAAGTAAPPPAGPVAAGSVAAAAPQASGPAAPALAPAATPATSAAGAANAASPQRGPASASPMVALPDRLDTVFLAKGGRVRGLVVEETPEGVVMRLVDGTERRYAPGQVSRVEYANVAPSPVAPVESAPAKGGK